MLTPETDAEEAVVAGHVNQLQAAPPAETVVETPAKRTRVRKPKADTLVNVVEPSPPQAAYGNPQPTPSYDPHVVTPPPPVQVGDVRTYPPAMGHHTQQNVAYDITMRAPVAIPAMASAPYVPQMQGVPVQVAPMMSQGPAHPTPGMIDVNAVRALALQVFRDPTRGGQQALEAALQASGVVSLQNLNQGNAGMLHYALTNRMGG